MPVIPKEYSKSNSILLGAGFSSFVLSLLFLSEHYFAGEGDSFIPLNEAAHSHPWAYLTTILIGTITAALLSMFIAHSLQLTGNQAPLTRGFLITIQLQTTSVCMFLAFMIEHILVTNFDLDERTTSEISFSGVTGSAMWASALTTCILFNPTAVQRSAIFTLCVVIIIRMITLSTIEIASPSGSPTADEFYAGLNSLLGFTGLACLYYNIPKGDNIRRDQNIGEMFFRYRGTNAACIGMDTGIIVGTCTGLLGGLISIVSPSRSLSPNEIDMNVMLPILFALFGMIGGIFGGFWLNIILPRIPTPARWTHRPVLFRGLCGGAIGATFSLLTELGPPDFWSVLLWGLFGFIVGAWSEKIRRARLDGDDGSTNNQDSPSTRVVA